MIGIQKKIIIAGFSLLVISCAIIAVLVVILSHSSNADKGSILGKYKRAAVSTNGQECSKIGTDILGKNGSAVDAAIAALLCESVASLHSMGLGGGFLMTIWDAKTKQAYYLDARETAPAAAHKDMFGSDPNLSMFGGLAVAVPGEIMGYYEAHKRFGNLPWDVLFEPAIKLCKKGSLVNNYLAAYLTNKEHLIKAQPSLIEILVNPETNSTWKAGDRIKRPKLAETMKLIAEKGPNIFYNGTLGDNFIKDLQAFKGIMTKEDLQNYRVEWKEPIETNVRNLTIYTAPPPGSGIILSFIMNVLQDLIPAPTENKTWQRIVETFKWAYARRTELGDPLFTNITNLINNMTSIKYVNAIRNKIKDNSTSNDPQSYGAVTDVKEDSGTAHVSVLAPDGSAVSVTSTINQVFGAMIRSTSTGIIYNDEMDDFSSPNITNGFGLPASPANYIEPGKRPLSSMSPTIVLDNDKSVRLVIGAAGGTKITSSVAIGMILNLWAGYDLKKAIDAPRIHHQLIPMIVQNEKGFNPEILKYLSNIGHNVTTFTGIGSAITGVAVQDGWVTANSDYRREGTIAGL